MSSIYYRTQALAAELFGQWKVTTTLLSRTNYTKEEFIVTIHRQEVNLEDEGINEGINLGNEGIKTELAQIYSYIQKNPLAKHADIQQLVNKSDATIERYLKILKKNGLIKYVGAKKTGGFEIIENE